MEKKVPYALGLIMDGNRRWAKANHLPTLEGHRRGLKRAKDVVNWAEELGVKEITLYAFSTENWNRTHEEVSYLMKLFQKTCEEELKEIIDRGGRVKFIGERNRIPKGLLGAMEKLERESKNNKGSFLQVGLSYGSRSEIVHAVNALLKSGTKQVDEKTFKNAMWSAGSADPDLIIRTGGDTRLSNFLLYQAAYSELHFTNTFWPDFSREEFESIIEAFATRERRRGK